MTWEGGVDFLCDNISKKMVGSLDLNNKIYKAKKN